MAIGHGGKSLLSQWVWLVLTTIIFLRHVSTLKIIEPPGAVHYSEEFAGSFKVDL